MTVGVLEFYSGIGGLHLALARSSVDAKVIQALDWDQTACNVYRANHGNVARKVDISTLTATELSRLKADLWLLSPACQPYTVLNPNAKGADDPRAQSFIHLVKNVLPALASCDDHPRRLLVENVAGFEDSTTRQTLVTTLRSIGYNTVELLLTPLQFGIPNSRLRYYLLAKKAPLAFKHVSPGASNEVWRQIPGSGPAWSDSRLDIEKDSTIDLSDILEIKSYLDKPSDEEKANENAVPDKILLKWGRLFDIVKPSSKRTCCFTRGYTQLVERAGSILQENEQLDTTSTFDEFLEAQSSGHPNAVDILHPLKLRYFSPSELLRIFAFESIGTDAKFIWPDNVSRKTKYKLIGNSVNVKVVQELIEYLFDECESG
ncbi:tRNA (cytosine(38)-C(5))-methyltransferase [Psilocybe cubensis]|uniref:tRNA (Cytosine(38)-C(5))-methyltransferase n=2 Tax=Psilocybe cubensis TaxID=181762 RepID=A0ACB8GV68_PSICU|nr:tRNA (cytosine(38)-C(5))-methyltransferase [Psilocybe cubensis]KAH9479332.1 tRNA (cytosine(38)-C(5))-methyltransferase [Psilocybe cubensis]